MPRILLLSNPRSGSTYLAELLSSHPDCLITGELLNNEETIQGDALAHVENIISKFPETYVGFKVFPDQIFERNLHFGDLARHIGATHVVILWRENILENLVSLLIALKTQNWYSREKATELHTVEVPLRKIRWKTKECEEEWEKIGEQWPLNVQPIFVKYEDLVSDPDKWLRFIFASLLCEVSPDFTFTAVAKRQNPAKLWDKISNWNEIPAELKQKKLNVQEILSEKINARLLLPEHIIKLAPDREPCMPAGGWRYRVADPFMPPQLKQNVFDAVSSGSVSSAGFWPRMMSRKLKEFFQIAVAQPCSNGFTALLLAMQTVHIGKEDEVIMPSMTMVAVANAVAFLGARPVFVDCTQENYNPGWSEIQNAITEKTKAVILTHTYGVPNSDLEKIVEECKRRGLWLIEDISECVGVKVNLADESEKLLGTFGDFACASMYVNKMIHAGDGGFILAKDPKVGSRLTSLVNHGFTPSYHFVHFEVATNSKINGLGAAMACGCLDQIETVMEHRNTVADVYRTLLKSLPLRLMPICGPYDTPWVFGIECENKNQRTELRKFLAENGIETRDFFFPLHLQPAFQDLPKVNLANCEIISSKGFYLPTHSNLKIGDLHYISSVIRVFFSPGKEITVKLIDPAPEQKPKFGIQIKPESFRVEVRSYYPSGEVKQRDYRGNLYVEAVKLGLEVEQYLVHENWDAKTNLISSIKGLIKRATIEGISLVEEYFNPYMQYFESQVNLEQPMVKPWAQINLDAPELLPAKCIPTTTDPETLQLLIWLVREMQPETIWEIGCWFGHATALMAAAGKMANCPLKIFACDGFKWQNWMRKFTTQDKTEEGVSFKGRFLKYTEKFQDAIETVNWPYGIQKLPEILCNQKPSLIFLDMTQEDEELEHFWNMMKPNFIPNETVIVFNGLSDTSIPFFTRHSNELIAVAKPKTIAKAFKYCTKPFVEEIKEEEHPHILERKLLFSSPPSWDHHHKNLFCESIRILSEKIHDKDAEILFVPAVEEAMCDQPELFKTFPWVGIIHSVENYKEHFYTPDLQRLCTPYYANLMKQCKGLYTLTKFQANYLRKHFPKDYTFPIQSLIYPMQELTGGNNPSDVPALWKQNKIIDLILIGSFARDFDLFFRETVPSLLRKVLLVGDSPGKDAAKRAPKNVFVMERLDENEYEEALRKSIIFLSLKYEGAANTLILECIARNLPIVAPDLESCVEYLGNEYPLLYDHKDPKLEQLITLENVEKAIKYFETMDKRRFHPDKFIESIRNGAVLLSLPPPPESLKKLHSFLDLNRVNSFPKFDVTVCICSYKRTHHLKNILESLWNKQDFLGTFQIIIWNNNDCRTGTVRDICRHYIQNSTEEKSLEVISSTANYYCSIRFAMPPLMKSEYLLICDDDIIPNENFISFFMSAKEKYPNDVLCLRGHKFFPHELNMENPTEVWHEYENLKFHGDDSPENLIHFVHADACMIPKRGLEEVASVALPDPSFSLVDDYWMSFILNHKFGRKLRKLSTKDSKIIPIDRTPDSDTVGLALHTRPEVQDARIRLYIHHMLQGWPAWPKETQLESGHIAKLRKQKCSIWDSTFIGFNISSEIDQAGITDLVKLGVSCVRIGAVGLGRIVDFELSGFISKSVDEIENQLRRLSKTVDLLAKENISVVLTLDRRVASASVWKTIANHFAHNPFLVGYDLINEPFTTTEDDLCWADVSTTIDPGMTAAKNTYADLISAIREVDESTPIIIEPTFWGHREALEKLPIADLLKKDSNLIVSFHFYEPMFLTQRVKNNGKFRFPGEVVIYEDPSNGESIYWDSALIREHFQAVLNWANTHGVKIFLGEFGICRDIQGANEYLKVIMTACKDLNISGFLFSFRDHDWDAMDYELGSDFSNIILKPNWQEGLMKTVVEGIRQCSPNLG